MTKLEILCKLHNCQGGTIHEYNNKYSLDILNLTNKEFFKFIYSICLKIAHKQYPCIYSWPESELLLVYERMCVAIEKGTFNKDGKAFQLACKSLKIKHTYQAINEYMKD